jgi:hypothetical protein
VNVPTFIEKEDKTLPLVRDIATILASLAAITVAMVQISNNNMLDSSTLLETQTFLR